MNLKRIDECMNHWKETLNTVETVEKIINGRLIPSKDNKQVVEVIELEFSKL